MLVTEENILVIRTLRVAFSATELRFLYSLDPFREVFFNCDGSQEAARAVVRAGGALLKQRDYRRKSRQLSKVPA